MKDVTNVIVIMRVHTIHDTRDTLQDNKLQTTITKYTYIF